MTFVHKDRMKIYHQASIKKNNPYLLYWMQAAARIEMNQALYLAITTANKHDLPLLVLFVLTKDFKEANLRHYQFLLEGIMQLKKDLSDLNIRFIIDVGDFKETLKPYIDDAAGFILDKSYLAPLVKIKEDLMHYAKEKDCLSVMVETEVIVPTHKASNKLEYGARTIRPKLLVLVDTYLENIPINPVNKPMDFPSRYEDYTIQDFLDLIKPDSSVNITEYFKGGYHEASKRLDAFIEHTLPNYGDNDPSKARVSTLSPYLHFGQISPVEIYLRIEAYKDRYPVQVEAYLEQLLVRRELAFNYVTYQAGYDQFETMTDKWAYETMQIHEDDPREYLYTLEDYLAYNTHDPYFNAAMKEMQMTGFMHNYMRMYWGKKIIEWSPTYKEAYETIKTLNNRLFYDGRDPNSYASIAWLFGKHDRGWTERAIFGKLRYMNANGLKRKFDIDKYVESINALDEKKD
jgi:deoxyribodipyrimidine photo-lyase